MNSVTPPAVQDRQWTPVVDQHATWIALNPIQGCPKKCAYCFLNERGQTAVRPAHVMSPADAVEALVASSFYGPSRPVALYTWTDVMALPASRAHLGQLLRQLAVRQVSNPIVVITKCHIPDETIESLCALRDQGVPVVVYVSYSGLGRDIEPGIRHDAVAENFPRLAAAGVPTVHYWRPAFPESAQPETLHTVFDHASRYARCTVAAGLKVEAAAVDRLAALWPQLATTKGVTQAEGVYPRGFWQFIHQTWQRNAEYPLFHTNSCALAFVLGKPDTFGVFGSSVCRMRNVCPLGQRQRCTLADIHRRPPTPENIQAALKDRGIGQVPFQLSADRRELVIDAAVPTNATAALTQDLGIRIRVARKDTDRYWSSGTAGATPVIIP